MRGHSNRGIVVVGNGKRSSSLAYSFKFVVMISIVIFIFVMKGFIQSSSPISSSSSSNTRNGNVASSNKKKGVVINQQPKKKPSLRLAFIGNSILFFNDCPSVLVRMLTDAGYDVTYNSCLEGGASLVSLMSGGCNPMFTKGNLDNITSAVDSKERTLEKLLSQTIDYVILHDQSRSPAVTTTREQAEMVLSHFYAPRLRKGGATPILLQTPAYRTTDDYSVPVAPEMGGFEELTKNLKKGYESYARVLTGYFTRKNNNDSRQKEQPQVRLSPRKALVAPVGEAFADVYHRDNELWQKLYVEDGIHPSPLGTWLQACVLYATILGKEPPMYKIAFFKHKGGRIRPFPGVKIYPLPTSQQAKDLWVVSMRVTGIMDEQSYVEH